MNTSLFPQLDPSHRVSIFFIKVMLFVTISVIFEFFAL